MATTKYLSRTNVIVLTLFLLIVSLQIAYCRRGGGGFRSSSSRVRQSSYRPKPSKPNKPTVYKPKRKKSFFDKGGIQTFGKIALGVYIARSLTPSIGFRPYGGYDRRRRPSYCYDCLSINGSDAGCETGSTRPRTCRTSIYNPYCSTEYGITNKDEKYVRRSCNGRLCDSCKKQFSNDTTDGNTACYTVQCDVCNWNYCNKLSVDKIFTAKWSGCTRDPKVNGTEFSDDDTCGGAMTTRLSGVLTILAGLTIVIFNL